MIPVKFVTPTPCVIYFTFFIFFFFFFFKIDVSLSFQATIKTEHDEVRANPFAAVLLLAAMGLAFFYRKQIAEV